MKVLLAGLGSIGQRHARNLRTLLGDDLELMAYRVRGLDQIIAPDARTATAGDVADSLGARVFTRLDEALALSPDVVFVTNPNACHMPVALAAARAGCHLFIEKPLSHTLDGVTELTELVERRGLVCLVGFQLRFHPAFKAVQRWVAAGAIGRVVAARLVFSEYLPEWHRYEDYRQSYTSDREQGGGVVLTQIHDLDCAYALFGLPRRVFAAGGHLSGLTVSAEDTASILMVYERDGSTLPVHLQQDMVSRTTRRSCEVLGDAGRLTLDFASGVAERFDAVGRLAESASFLDYDRNDLFLDELRHLLACLRHEEQPIVNICDGTASLRMALAARESLESGRVVELT